MNNVGLFTQLSYDCSQSVTRKYSTSFFSAIKLLRPDLREPIHAVYGMVRFADEIVDTFHEFDKQALLKKFKEDTFEAISQGISLNPILQSFQKAVKRYNIGDDLIEAFFRSMELDLQKQDYLSREEFEEYIYGSAEVVGLMCLCIFCDGDQKLYDSLKVYAKALGAAFQKINFLRDLQSDIDDLDRCYFPNFKKGSFNEVQKRQIEKDIENDFELAYEGIKRLPVSARFGVYVAYRYYMALFKKVKKSNAEAILEQRIRIPNHIKLVIVLKAGLRNQLNLI
ncbi:phytoene/squalene synthase family protein [Pedobacter sp. SYSU D00535]|uniref:phytoene/squalene synthase family protein n=1 Tax=Pedobacter sp. SYSU D00535 TaxID=2810308 RepID=UPI001A95BE2B|nr:phytoene/squalene synthase family protein [Pedobacter sp. SYSU D00535]